MYSGKTVSRLEFHLFYNLPNDSAMVQFRVTLHDGHILEIIVKCGSFYKRKVFIHLADADRYGENSGIPGQPNLSLSTVFENVPESF